MSRPTNGMTKLFFPSLADLLMKFETDGPRGLYFEEFEFGVTMRTRGRTITEADLGAVRRA